MSQQRDSTQVVGAVAALTMLAWLSWLVPPFAAVASAQVRDIRRDEEIVIPEVYFSGDRSDLCVIRGDLDEHDLLRRRDRLIGFILSSFRTTGAFYIITLGPCANRTGTVERTLDFFTRCLDGAGTCNGTSVRFTLDTSSRIAAVYKEPEPPVAIFERMRGQSDLSRCTMKAKLREGILADDKADHLLESLYSLITKYRMPLMDVYVVNDNAYFLFSRSCDDKAALASQMISLLSREGVEWSTNFGEIVFSPDVSEYRFAQIGFLNWKPPPGLP